MPHAPHAFVTTTTSYVGDDDDAVHGKQLRKKTYLLIRKWKWSDGANAFCSFMTRLFPPFCTRILSFISIDMGSRLVRSCISNARTNENRAREFEHFDN